MGTARGLSEPVSTDYSTAPTRQLHPPDRHSGSGWALAITLVALAVLGVLALILLDEPTAPGALPNVIPGWTRLATLLVFLAALIGWIHRRWDDTFVSLAAAAAMVAIGSLDAHALFGTLGAEPMWLLLAAFILAAGISRTGLPTRLAIVVVGRARSPRHLVHLITAGIEVTAVLVPSTGGRAALVVPVYVALATAFAERERLVRALAVLFPTVVLLSAIATLVGAGAHLITAQVLATTAGTSISFGQWLLWGVPFAVVSSHLAAELVLLLFTRRQDRTTPLRVDSAELREQTQVPDVLQREEIRAGALLAVVVALWSTESLHGLPPALVAVGAALLITAPRFGTVRLDTAIAEVPWSLLLFMAATSAMGIALTSSGAAGWLAGYVLHGSGPGLLITVIVLSIAAHLVIQSRSARSSVLIPLVVPAALTAGLNPVALAFASTAAAGFCHTLPASSKPVAMFARIEGVATYEDRDLLKLSALLGPLLAVLVLLFSTAVWPYLGLTMR